MFPTLGDQNQLLAKLGLFIEPNFLSTDECVSIEREMRRVEAVDGLITDVDGRQVLDPARRTSSYRFVSSETVDLVESRLVENLAGIETHFGVPIDGYEGPRFVTYGSGQFFAPHRDDQGDRRINLTVLLSDRRAAAGDGSLVIYGLVDGDGWEHRGFPVDLESGTLIGYRSDLVHEVRPVTGSEKNVIVFHLLGSAEDR